jgi:hypothetical protein
MIKYLMIPIPYHQHQQNKMDIMWCSRITAKMLSRERVVGDHKLNFLLEWTGYEICLLLLEQQQECR